MFFAGRLLGALLFLPQAAAAGDFAVSPIRLDLDQVSRNGSITVTNDADSELRIQVRLLQWEQATDGRDVYTESDDLLFFPQLAAVAPKEQRIIRVGRRAPSTEAREKSYRLFIEELPDNAAPGERMRLAVAIRFGVPVFVKPAREEPRGAIEHLSLAKGKLNVKVHNTGNVHFKIDAIRASGEGFAAETNGRYLLPGTQRDYTIDVPPAACANLKRIDVTVDTDRLQLRDTLPLTPDMCDR